MAVLSSAASLDTIPNLTIPLLLRQIGSLSTIGVPALGIFNFILYISFNAALRRNMRPAAPLISSLASSKGVTSLDSVTIQPLPSETPEHPSEINTPLPLQPAQTPSDTEPDQIDMPADDNTPTPPESTP
jgi:hypothetical protein